MKIAHITDLHLDEEFPFGNTRCSRLRFEYILNDIVQQKCDHIICTGDIGEKSSLPYFFSKIEKFHFELTLGNHDFHDEVKKYYQTSNPDNISKFYESKIYKNIRITFLDSSEGAICNNQIRRIKSYINAPQEYHLIFLHHPILGLDMKVDEIGALNNRTQIETILSNFNSHVFIFCGHYHMDHFSYRSNISQYITPSTCYQIKKTKMSIELNKSTIGYRIIEVQKDGIKSKVQLINYAN